MRTKLNYVDVFSGCSSGCLWRYPQYHWLKQDNIFPSFANPSMMYLRLSFPLSFTSTSIFLRCSAFSTSFRTALLQVHITAELRREREKKAFPFLVKDTISPIVSSDWLGLFIKLHTAFRRIGIWELYFGKPYTPLMIALFIAMEIKTVTILSSVQNKETVTTENST